MRKQLVLGVGGFTLLELVIAGMLASLIAVAAGLLVSRGLVASRRMEDRLQQIFALEKTLEKLGREFRNSVIPVDEPFLGAQDEVAFVTAEGPDRLVRLRYKFSSTLVRESQPFPSPPEAPKNQSLIDQVSSFTVSYGVLEEANDQKTFLWAESWDGAKKPSKIPRLIRVQMQAQGSQGRTRSVVREFLIPQGVLETVTP